MADRAFDDYVTDGGRGLAMVVGERVVRGSNETEKFVRWPNGERQRMLPGRKFLPTLDLSRALAECPDLPDDWRPGNDDAMLAFGEAFMIWRRQYGLDCALAPDEVYQCTACGRKEFDCSLNPCEAVERDREA